ncbi:MAG: PEP-CTERM sorting domain-containing protein [Phycisphaerales bacterium]
MRNTATSAAVVLAGCAALAPAQIQQASGLSINATPTMTAADSQLFLHDVSLAGVVHNNLQGSTWNTVFQIDLGDEDLVLTGLSWDLSATSQHNLPLEGLRIAILNAAGDGVVLDPFMGQTNVGAGSAFLDLHDLTADGMDFDLAGGDVFVEFFVTSNLFAGPEGWYATGSHLTLQTAPVPAPGALALMGLGGLAAVRRRR